MLPATMDAPVSVAILGLGRMGSMHARLIAERLPCLRLVALADRLPGRAGATARALGVEVAEHQDTVAALDGEGLEACVIVTPTVTHHELVSEALGRGLHVFCEKPLTLDPELDIRLGEAAASAGLVLQVGFWRRFSPPWVAARRAIRRGEIGSPLFLRLSQWDAALPPPAFHDPAVSGGLIVDCGVHEFDLVEWLTEDRIVRIQGHPLPLAHAELETTGDLDNALVVAHLGHGAVAAIDLSRNAGYADDIRSEILGSRGAVLVGTVPNGRASLGTAEGLCELPGSAVDDAFAEGVASELRAFAAAVRGGNPSLPGARESARALMIAQAATRSATTGRPETIPGPG